MASTSGFSHAQNAQSWTRYAPSQHLASQSRPIDQSTQSGPPSSGLPPPPLLPIHHNATAKGPSIDTTSTKSRPWTSSSSQSGRTVDRSAGSNTTSQSSAAHHNKKKAHPALGLGGLFTLKDPSIAAMDEMAQTQKKQNISAKEGRAVFAGIPLASSQKLPESVPKVNSKWDGLPLQAVVKPKDSTFRRDSGFSSRIPFQLQTSSVATVSNKSSSAYSEPPESPFASSNVLPDDNRRREFPWAPPWASRSRSATTASSSAHTGTTSSPSAYDSPVEQRKPHEGSSSRSFDKTLPVIPNVSALIDELMPPSPEHVISPQSSMSLRAAPVSLLDRRAPSPMTEETIGPVRGPPQQPLPDPPQQSERSRKRAIEEASRAKVEAYLHDQASCEDLSKPYKADAGGDRVAQRSAMLVSKPSSHDRRFDNVPASAPHNILSHSASHARNPSLETVSRITEDRPKSLVSSSQNARIRYSLPPPEPALRSRQNAVPVYIEARRCETPQPRTSEETIRSGGGSTGGIHRKNFSRPLHGHRPSQDIAAGPTSPPLNTAGSQSRTRYVSPSPPRKSSLASPFVPMETDENRHSTGYQDREPSREVRRPQMSPRAQSNVSETAKTYAMSTAFWETAAAQSTDNTTKAKDTSPTIEEPVPFNCRLDGPFDPGLAWYG